MSLLSFLHKKTQNCFTRPKLEFLSNGVEEHMTGSDSSYANEFWTENMWYMMEKWSRTKDSKLRILSECAGEFLGCYVHFVRRQNCEHERKKENVPCVACLKGFLVSVAPCAEFVLQLLDEEICGGDESSWFPDWKQPGYHEEEEDNQQQEQREKHQSTEIPSGLSELKEEEDETSVCDINRFTSPTKPKFNQKSRETRLNSPSLILTRVADEKLLSCDRSYFNLKWKIWCDLLFDEKVPAKFSCRNIASIDPKGKTGLTISFKERPKRVYLEQFVEGVSKYGLGCRMFLFVENYSPPWKTSPPSLSRNVEENLSPLNIKTNLRTPPNRKSKTSCYACGFSPSFGSCSSSSTHPINYSPPAWSFPQPAQLQSFSPPHPMCYTPEANQKITHLESKMEHISALLATQTNWIKKLIELNG